MKPLSLLVFATCILLSNSASARGGMGSHMSMAGGALGARIAAPGTNSLGTALPSDSSGHAMNGPLLGTDPEIDREDARLQKKLDGAVCRGC